MESKMSLWDWYKQFQVEGESKHIAWNHAVQRAYEVGDISADEADTLDRLTDYLHETGEMHQLVVDLLL